MAGALALILLLALQSPSGPRVPVLMYHRVADLSVRERHDPLVRDLTVPRESFRRQLDYLCHAGFRIVSDEAVVQALRSGSLSARTVAITFDDGYLDNYTVAFPLLKSRGASATVFLVLNTVATPGHVNWTQAQEMMASGIRMGSHSASHPDLPGLSSASLRRELSASMAGLRRRLPGSATTLAYPSGRYDDRVARAVRSAGYAAAWRKEGGPVRPGADLMRLPRVMVRGAVTLREFARLVGGPPPGRESGRQSGIREHQRHRSRRR